MAWEIIEDKQMPSKWEEVSDQPLRATEEDKSQAFEQIKQRFPNWPESAIKMLMPLATHMAETKDDAPMLTGRKGAFMRSALRTPLQSAENLAETVGLPTVKDAEFPAGIAERPEDVQYPFTEFAGGITGFLPLGVGTISATRAAIPAWSRFAKSAAPSLVRRGLVHGAEAAGLGALFGKKGEKLENALISGLLGAGLGTLGVSAVRSSPKGWQRAKNIYNLDALEGKIEPAQQALETSEQALEGEQALAKRTFGTQDPDALAASAQDDLSKIQSLQSQIEQTPEVDTTKMLGAPKGEELVPRAQSMLSSAEEKAAQAELALSEHLNKGATHDENIAQGVMYLHNANKQEIQELYQQLDNSLENKNVVLKNPRTAQDIMNDLTELIKTGDSRSPEAAQLANELETLSKEETIPAKDFLNAYRTTRDLAQEAYSRGYDPRLNAEEQQNWRKQGEKLSNKAKSMHDTLTENIGDEDSELLQQATKRWRNEVAPLYENKLFNKFKFEGRGPENIMKELRGTGKGQDILRQYVKSNPELLKNVVGQLYADTPGKLHDAGELVQQYTDLMPKLRSLKEAHKDASQAVNKAKIGVKNAKAKAKAMSDEAKRVEMSFNELKKQQIGRQEAEQLLNKLRDILPEKQSAIVRLRQRANRRDINLKEKIKREKELKEAREDLDELKKKIKWLAKWAARAALIGTAGYEVGRRY